MLLDIILLSFIDYRHQQKNLLIHSLFGRGFHHPLLK